MQRISIFSVLALMLFVGCQKPLGEQSSQAQSKDHLRTALVFLDKGDNNAAEKELGLSLAADPLNNRARTTLASIYASQAGIILRDWLDPFWDVGKKLKDGLQDFQQSSDVIDSLTTGMKHYYTEKEEAMTPQEKEARNRTSDLAQNLAKFSLGTSVVLDVFHGIPFLNEPQLRKLDQAIFTLRDTDVSVPDRDEEHRVYLSILSFVRLVNHLKRLIGDHEIANFTATHEYVCNLSLKSLKKSLDHIRVSLAYLEEGLTVGPHDPPTSQRKVRSDIQKFITQFLSSVVWEHLDELFDAGTLEGQAANRLGTYFCRDYKNQPNHVGEP